jgi:hypothetical protein
MERDRQKLLVTFLMDGKETLPMKALSGYNHNQLTKGGGRHGQAI